MDNRKISICIPTYNRFQMTVESIQQILDDNRVLEIVIVDDHSTDGAYGDLQKYYEDNDKVKVYGNFVNLDCYRNKHRAVQNATGEWCILFDSDNILTKEYIDVLYTIPEWDIQTVYQPCYLKPHFDYRQYAGVTLDKINIGNMIHSVETVLNAQNCFVNRDEYLRIWDDSVDPVTSDSLFFNSCWIEKGNSVYLVPGLEYEHRVHSGSHYQNNVSRTPSGFHQSIINKLKNL